MELLPHVLVEDILQRLAVKSLLRFTSVSRLWNSTIKSKYFASNHLIRAQSRNPDILLCRALYAADNDVDDDSNTYSFRTLTLGSSDIEKIHILPKSTCYEITESCDGLVCAYNFEASIYVINPATRWHRSLPRSKLQQVNRLRRNLNHELIPISPLGFGKDTSTGNYKVVWLYDSFDKSLRGPTTCEVYDFNTNTWRYVTVPTHASHYHTRPVFVDGSLYWLALGLYEDEIIKILSFDLRTEVFQAMSETPITHALPRHVNICSLNGRLCVSDIKGYTQEIWTLNTHKTWEKTFSIDLGCPSIWFGIPIRPATPVAVFEEEKLLLYDYFAVHPGLVVQNTRLDSYCFYLHLVGLHLAVSYFPSVISI